MQRTSPVRRRTRQLHELRSQASHTPSSAGPPASTRTTAPGRRVAQPGPGGERFRLLAAPLSEPQAWFGEVGSSSSRNATTAAEVQPLVSSALTFRGAPAEVLPPASFAVKMGGGRRRPRRPLLLVTSAESLLVIRKEPHVGGSDFSSACIAAAAPAALSAPTTRGVDEELATSFGASASSASWACSMFVMVGIMALARAPAPFSSHHGAITCSGLSGGDDLGERSARDAGGSAVSGSDCFELRGLLLLSLGAGAILPLPPNAPSSPRIGTTDASGSPRTSG